MGRKRWAFGRVRARLLRNPSQVPSSAKPKGKLHFWDPATFQLFELQTISKPRNVFVMPIREAYVYVVVGLFTSVQTMLGFPPKQSESNHTINLELG